ncbi:MAG: hypothetical protein HY569_02350 [Candidatus Magasanikbacteria bacterium]|nr:hypothetical protein [Candidatus Magasanikbacteria bacterium]
MNLPKILQTYGLSEKQAKVYLACLELGSGPVVKIAQKARLSRSTVYEVLEHLVDEGFVSTYNKKQIHYFSAEDPGQIIRLAESRAATLKDALPELNAIAGRARKRPTVRFYQGKEEMGLILNEIVSEAEAITCFASAGDYLSELGERHRKFLMKRMEKKIPVRVIARDSAAARERQALAPKELRQMKLVKDDYPFHGLKYIWKNKIAMFSFTGDFVAVVIESKELADMEMAMFENLWERV